MMTILYIGVNMTEQVLLEKRQQTDKLLNTEEAADFLNCSPVTLWRLRKQGLLFFRRVMGKILFRQSDLEELLERCKRGGHAIKNGEAK